MGMDASTAMLAKTMGVSTSTLWMIEHGQADPTISTLGGMAEALYVTDLKDLFKIGEECTITRKPRTRNRMNPVKAKNGKKKEEKKRKSVAAAPPEDDLFSSSRKERIGNNIRSARMGKGFSCRKTAKGAGISPATLLRIEREEVSLSVSTLVRIADALGEPLEKLLDGV